MGPGLVPTFCINSTRGRGGHESPRWIRALVCVVFCGYESLLSIVRVRKYTHHIRVCVCVCVRVRVCCASREGFVFAGMTGISPEDRLSFFRGLPLDWPIT